jgi:hypothetical protein
MRQRISIDQGVAVAAQPDRVVDRPTFFAGQASVLPWPVLDGGRDMSCLAYIDRPIRLGTGPAGEDATTGIRTTVGNPHRQRLFRFGGEFVASMVRSHVMPIHTDSESLSGFVSSGHFGPIPRSNPG